MTVVAQDVAHEEPARAPWPTGEQRFLLHNISWQQYVAIGEALRDRPGLRITYDRGNLELMTTSPLHEKFKKRLARLIEVLAEEFGLAIETAGNMTFARKDIDRGMEPDDCFWIAHEADVRGRREWDPATDPPPDLMIEIEISRNLLDRMKILAALGVPEVWRFDGDSVRVLLLQPDRTYRPGDASPTFPGIPLQELVRFAQPDEHVDYLSMVRSFRAWVRQHLPKANP
jgi:Uma2 family endonuclease